MLGKVSVMTMSTVHLRNDALTLRSNLSRLTVRLPIPLTLLDTQLLIFPQTLKPPMQIVPLLTKPSSGLIRLFTSTPNALLVPMVLLIAIRRKRWPLGPTAALYNRLVLTLLSFPQCRTSGPGELGTEVKHLLSLRLALRHPLPPFRPIRHKGGRVTHIHLVLIKGCTQ